MNTSRLPSDQENPKKIMTRKIAIGSAVALTVIGVGAVFFIHKAGKSPGTVEEVPVEEPGAPDAGQRSQGQGGGGRGTSRPAAPGKPTGAAIAPPAPGTRAEAKPEAPRDACYTIAFRHTALSSHDDGEACARHKNVIELGALNVRKDSLCVRVNGTPVKHQFVAGHPNRVVIAAVAGPKAEVTARFCVGSAQCNEQCKIPKDDFMAALGADEDSEEAEKPGRAPARGWQAAGAQSQVQKDLDHEVDRMKTEIREGEQGQGLFDGWVKKKENVACG